MKKSRKLWIKNIVETFTTVYKNVEKFTTMYKTG